MHLKNAWYCAAWDTEVEGDKLLTRRLLGVDFVLFRGDDGKVVALEDRCCHRLAPLSHGQREGNCIRCMYHGLVFDGAGRCVEVPGQDRISDKLRVRALPVVERDHLVWAWMGDPALAEPSAIYDTHWHDTAGWSAERGGYIHYKAAAALIADNLLDFSHLAFVHSKTIGTRKQGSVRPEVDFGAESVSVRFTTLEGPPPPFARALSQLPDVVDRFNFYVWNIRGNYFVQDSVIGPVGEGYETQSALAMKLHTFIALTPEDENSCHYFWSTAHNDFASPASDVTSQLTRQVATAFEEDRSIIEAQQASIDRAPNTPMIGIAADSTLTRVRRMADELLASEQVATAPRSALTSGAPSAVAA